MLEHALSADARYSQQVRLLFIDMRLRFIGTIKRADLVENFGVRTSAATRDLAIYREEAPSNLRYVSHTKSYVREPSFAPLFRDVSANDVLSRFLSGTAPLKADRRTPSFPIEAVVSAEINVDVLANLTRSITMQSCLEVALIQQQEGLTSTTLVPHAIFEAGNVWFTRTFVRCRNRFEHVALESIATAVQKEDDAPRPHELAATDYDWNRHVSLRLRPHPKSLANPDRREKMLNVRAALASRTLRQLSVDCSHDQRLRGPLFLWHLENWGVLMDVPDPRLAPGFTLKRPADRPSRDD